MASGEKPLSVTQAVALATRAIRTVPSFALVGEVSGWKGPHRGTGHCYFKLKDEETSLDVILWNDVFGTVDFDVRDGVELLVRGTFRIYKKTGALSFSINEVEPYGEGRLRRQVDLLARRLRAEGLMADERKRPIPAFCERVAVVTSLSGSVIDDVKRTLRRRNPLVRLYVSGCAVQGEGAEDSIVAALARVAAMSPPPECVLLVRGGGSYEDLMTFNDERVARAVASCPVPVVTGIGHEPDVTICDMVSDRRASTPTAAAETVAPDVGVIARTIDGRAERLARWARSTVDGAASSTQALGERLALSTAGAVARERQAVEALARHRCLTDPTSLVDDRAARLRQDRERMDRALARSLAALSEAVEALGRRRCLTDPAAFLVDDQVEDLQQSADRLDSAMERRLAALSEGVEALAARRGLADPAGTVLRGRRERLGGLSARLRAAGGRQAASRTPATDSLASRLRAASVRVAGPHRREVAALTSMLEALSPLKVLTRGYAIVTGAGGHVVASPADVAVGDEVAVRLAGGSIRAEVLSVMPRQAVDGAGDAGRIEGK